MICDFHGTWRDFTRVGTRRTTLLKRLKTKLQTTMGDEKLNDLMVIAVEKEETRTLKPVDIH